MLSFIKRILGRKNAVAPSASSVEEFLSQLNITTDNIDLYVKALTHGSSVKKQVESNERLEFVGDAVLGAAIADILYRQYPHKNEGRLSKMRSKLVSRKALNKLGTLLNIPDYLQHKIGVTEFNTANNYIGNAFEALIGAIYLDKGYNFTYNFVVERILQPFLDLDELDNEIRDFKSYVIIWAQKNKRSFEFTVSRMSGSGEESKFTANLLIDGEVIASGEGRNKKTAQQNAAMHAIPLLDIGEQ